MPCCIAILDYAELVDALQARVHGRVRGAVRAGAARGAAGDEVPVAMRRVPHAAVRGRRRRPYGKLECPGAGHP
ncbi:hypothetical protein OCS_02044 [Ophiocordyceps sinensis CO18]|uniref:Uncharacterized protein n=1 Tax=Ophiocordyceps sinensis (strain Co18 / CGMCC 3.14243) TaxID=911162 RepID=T5AIK5_OPHSC|nr:hypothetical protein OCS_02044 [Ophiocordyceps sinensis CO18]